MNKPAIYYDNTLRDAQKGDDGTEYATCSLAVRDADDPFKVRGHMQLSADVAAISSLVGTQAKMDDTGNAYQVTAIASNPYGSALQTLLAPYAENNHGQMVKVGSYVYTVCNKTVFKLDPSVSPPTVVERLALPTSETAAFTLVCADGSGTWLYVATTAASMMTYIIRISTFAIEWSGALPVAHGTSLVNLAADNSNLFAVSAITTGRYIDKFALGPDPTSLVHGDFGTLTFYDPQALYAGASDGYLYAALHWASGGNCNFAFLKILKSTLGGLVTKFSSTLMATGITGSQLAICGNNLYSFFTDAAGTTGYAIKIDITNFAAGITEVALAAGEYPVRGVASDGTDVYYYCNTSPIKVVKVTAASFTRASGLTLNSGENGTAGYGNICYDGAAIYVGCTTSPAILVEVTTALARTGALTYYKGLTDAGEGAKVSSGQYAYIAYAHSPARIGKWDLESGQLVCQLELNSGENAVAGLDIGDDGYLYAACAVTPAILVKIDIATSITAMTRTAALTLAAGEGPGNAVVCDAGEAYVGCGSTAGKIVKVIMSDMSHGGTITFTAGRNDVRYLVISGTDIYAGCYSNHVVKNSLSTFTETSAVDTGNPVIEMAQDATYLYTIMNANTANIRRIAISGFSLGSALDTGSAAAPVACLMVGGNLHVHYGTTKFDIVDTTTWAVVQSITSAALDAVAQGFRRMLLYSNYVWLVNEGGSSEYAYSSLIQVDPYSSLSLFDRLQDADVGDSFSLRAGLTCAQAAASYPAQYAADNALSPVHKGTSNTAHYLRVHLPNLLTDGGFESGAFSPNWTAEATNPWVIESTTELEGAYSASWDLVASKYLRQSGTSKLEKGRTYRLIFKAKSVTANPTSGAITVNLFQTGSGTAVDSDASGTTPAITTSVTWFAIDFTPDFETDDWYLNIAGDSTKANGATEITVDEFYLYEKPTVNMLTICRHNLVGKSGLVVKAYKCSPLRSTIGADDYTEIKASFTVTTSENYEAALTASYDPIYELYIPATSGFVPEFGELFISGSWSLSHYPKGSLDPYKENADGLREISLDFTNKLAPSLRLTIIKDFFRRLKAGDAWLFKWDTDAPILMGTPRAELESAFAPYRTGPVIKGVEKP